MATPVCHGRPGEEHVSSEMNETEKLGLWRCPECGTHVETEGSAADELLNIEHVEEVQTGPEVVRVFTDLEAGSDEAVDVLVKVKRVVGSGRKVVHQST